MDDYAIIFQFDDHRLLVGDFYLFTMISHIANLKDTLFFLSCYLKFAIYICSDIYMCTFYFQLQGLAAGRMRWLF